MFLPLSQCNRWQQGRTRWKCTGENHDTNHSRCRLHRRNFARFPRRYISVYIQVTPHVGLGRYDLKSKSTEHFTSITINELWILNGPHTKQSDPDMFTSQVSEQKKIIFNICRIVQLSINRSSSYENQMCKPITVWISSSIVTLLHATVFNQHNSQPTRARLCW